MFVGQVSLRVRIWAGAFVGQVSVAPSGTKTGTEPVWMAQRRSASRVAHAPADALLQLIQQRLVDVSWQK
jgi:hypothetical protein